MPNTAPDNHLHVVAAVIHDPDDETRVLISQRHADSHQGGKWEFPGGKVEPGEDPATALKRELHEELGITVKDAKPFIRVNHVYPDKAVHLDVWRVNEFQDPPAGREGQTIKWVNITRLHDYDYPQANIPIIRALELPPVYAISAAGRMGQDVFIGCLRRALENGLQLLQLREPDLDSQAYADLARIVISECHGHDARVILNTEADLVGSLGADGLQVNSRRLMQLRRRPLAGEKLVFASCHDLEELHRAESIGVDAALLSPVLETPSHPGARILGWAGFSKLVAQTSIPVYALGGMRPESLQLARSHGATGIAMITAFWERYRT